MKSFCRSTRPERCSCLPGVTECTDTPLITPAQDAVWDLIEATWQKARAEGRKRLWKSEKVAIKAAIDAS